MSNLFPMIGGFGELSRNARMFGEDLPVASTSSGDLQPLKPPPLSASHHLPQSSLPTEEEPSRKKPRLAEQGSKLSSVLTIEKLISKDKPPPPLPPDSRGEEKKPPIPEAVVSRPQQVSCLGLAGNPDDLKAQQHQQHPFAKSRIYKNKKYRCPFDCRKYQDSL